MDSYKFCSSGGNGSKVSDVKITNRSVKGNDLVSHSDHKSAILVSSWTLRESLCLKVRWVQREGVDMAMSRQRAQTCETL